ncbi:MAG TPA: DUF4058 family protein [Gemmataceae bacterium]|nr:DUF4058 family protein [Gemmataceae bacterium]
MKSPFPGLDPYVEVCGLWESFHNHRLEAIYQSHRESTARRLCRRYRGPQLYRPTGQLKKRPLRSVSSVKE